MLVTLRNDFHNTQCQIRPAKASITYRDGTATLRLGTAQAARARRKLCGIRGCVCSGIAGTRGPQLLDDGTRMILV